MRFPITLLAVLLAAVPAVAAPAPAVSDFVVRLGRDTVSAEHVERSADRIDVRQVGRAPRVLQRHYVYEYARGDLARLTITVQAPGAETPVQTVDVRVDGDSIRIETVTGTAAAVRAAIAAPRGTLPVPSSSAWTTYEGQLMKLARSGADSLRATIWLVGAPTVDWVAFRRLGGDSVEVANGHADVFHVRMDRQGRVLAVRPISGTGKVSVERVAHVDVDALVAQFGAEERAAGNMGMLSPRDSVVTTVAGAALRVDYCRPAKRGRQVFGSVVPWGQVWRTGANAATVFRTDHALAFGDVVVPAGAYTLWTVPAPQGWTLLVNSQTGQWGTEHDPARDLFRIPLVVDDHAPEQEHFGIRVEPAEGGGAIVLEWDTTRALAAFKVRD